MKINVLSDKIGWFGKYSGYECLPDYYPKSVEKTINIATYNIYNKVLGKFYKVQNKVNSRSEDIFNEIKFLRKASSSDASHILYLESHMHLLNEITPRKKVFGTIHLPVSTWSKNRLLMLENLENVILLYNEEVDIFKQYVPSQKIHVIKHGVDIDFFKPGNPASVIKNRILFVGHFLRNFEMTLQVFTTIRKEISNNLEFHFIIPAAFRNTPVIQKIQQFDKVFFHEKLSDEELLEQYQTSNLLVMPMEDSGANTAIIQALSVGLPIITTNVGGIKSYGGGNVFPIIQNNDVIGMCELIFKYLDNDNFRNEVSADQREFSKKFLDWHLVAKQHIELYKQKTLQFS
ncbi:MAG: glycosyltransferase family 4 protein [Chitinophagaceae bacterium]|nr:glycosyltransferase family 4 protein [Chitinophagaceae bacterium]